MDIFDFSIPKQIRFLKQTHQFWNSPIHILGPNMVIPSHLSTPNFNQLIIPKLPGEFATATIFSFDKNSPQRLFIAMPKQIVFHQVGLRHQYNANVPHGTSLESHQKESQKGNASS